MQKSRLFSHDITHVPLGWWGALPAKPPSEGPSRPGDRGGLAGASAGLGGSNAATSPVSWLVSPWSSDSESGCRLDRVSGMRVSCAESPLPVSGASPSSGSGSASSTPPLASGLEGLPMCWSLESSGDWAFGVGMLLHGNNRIRIQLLTMPLTMHALLKPWHSVLCWFLSTHTVFLW